MRHVFLFAAWLTTGAAAAQTTRIWRDAAVLPEAQIELAGPNRNYGFVGFGGRRETDFSDPNGEFRRLGLDVQYLVAGYERSWNERWSWGPTLRLATARNAQLNATPGVLLRHRAALGPFTFGQRLALEYVLTPNWRYNPFFGFESSLFASSRTLLRLRFDLEKTFTLGDAADGFALRPRLSFEPAAYVRLQREETDPDKRTVDFTGLRAEVGCRFSPRFDLTPWFALQTQYVATLVQYDAQGNPTSNGKLNVRTPAVGLELRYTVLPGTASPDRQQLPTQH